MLCSHLMPVKRWLQPCRVSSTRAISKWHFYSTKALSKAGSSPPSASHAASVVFARKTDGTWSFCQDYSEHNAITQKLVELLQHVDQLIDEAHSAWFFTKFYLAIAYMQFQIRAED